MLYPSQTERAMRRVRPLSAANSLRASAVATAVVGAALVIAPGTVFTLTTGDSAAGGIWVRATGIALVTMASVFGSAARWPASMMQRPVMLAAAIVATVAAIAWFLGSAGPANGSFWAIPVAAEVAIATWLWWLLIADRV
jgi:hypothetical protein